MVKFRDITTGAGLLSFSSMAAGTGKVFSSLTHEIFVDAFGTVYKL